MRNRMRWIVWRRSDYLMTMAGAALFATYQVDRCSLLTGDLNWIYCQPCHFCKCWTELWNQRVSLRNERSEVRDFKRSTVTQLIFGSKSKSNNNGASKQEVLTYRKSATEVRTLLQFLPPLRVEVMDKDFRLKSGRNQRSDATDAVDQWSGLCLFQVSFIGTSLKGQLMGPHLTTKWNFLPLPLDETKQIRQRPTNHTPIIRDPCALEQT